MGLEWPGDGALRTTPSVDFPPSLNSPCEDVLTECAGPTGPAAAAVATEQLARPVRILGVRDVRVVRPKRSTLMRCDCSVKSEF